MINRQMRSAGLHGAVLAGFAIAREHTAARARQPQAAWDLDIAHKPDHYRNIKRETLGAQTLRGSLDQLGLFLQQQNDRTPSRDYLKWLVASVENENTLPQAKPPFQSRTICTHALQNGDRPELEHAAYDICGAGAQHHAGAPGPTQTMVIQQRLTV